jgi:hypothetical protein
MCADASSNYDAGNAIKSNTIETLEMHALCLVIPMRLLLSALNQAWGTAFTSLAASHRL